MNEKVIIQEESRIPKKVAKIWKICLIVMFSMGVIAFGLYKWFEKLFDNASNTCWRYEKIYSYSKAHDLTQDLYDKAHSVYNLSVGVLCVFFVLILVAIVLFFFAIPAGNKIVVTDKRVYGVAAFGKRVDLPMDSISVVSTKGRRRIVIASSSGMIKFAGLKKRDEVHNAISTLLIQRQQMRVANTSPIQMPSTSGAEEIKSYKELLDQGMITQEDFELKKKQILGL